MSGYAKPSQRNQAAFEQAVDDVADATRRLVETLATDAPPRNRDAEAAKARERARLRFGE